MQYYCVKVIEIDASNCSVGSWVALFNTGDNIIKSKASLSEPLCLRKIFKGLAFCYHKENGEKPRVSAQGGTRRSSF